MSKFTLLGAVAVMAAAAASPALAQAANSEPGYCAQFYPNADCNSVGPETPGSRSTEKAAESEPGEAASAVAPAPVAAPKKKKSHAHAAVAPPK
jgi:hypothetical protein